MPAVFGHLNLVPRHHLRTLFLGRQPRALLSRIHPSLRQHLSHSPHGRRIHYGVQVGS